jgi:UPF0755 protein
MSPSEMLEVLGHGRADAIVVTLIEGLRREEIASTLMEIFNKNNLSFDEKQFLKITHKDEGYLFPDTYEFLLNANAESIAATLKSTLNKKISTQLTTDIKKSGKTLHEILTMASLIEREARTVESRRMVSGILWNRINSDWPLQVDATLQYAKGYDKTSKNWWATPLAIDKEIISLYNTYKNTGLPPGPICNPSLSSIEAAVYPTDSSFWYYITDNNGTMHYAETIDQHNQNVNKYLR